MFALKLLQCYSTVYIEIAAMLMEEVIGWWKGACRFLPPILLLHSTILNPSPCNFLQVTFLIGQTKDSQIFVPKLCRVHEDKGQGRAKTQT